MRRVMCCWELGGGYGHLYPLLPFILEFERLGLEVVAVVRNLARAEQVFGRHGIRVLQAPTWWTPERFLPRLRQLRSKPASQRLLVRPRFGGKSESLAASF